MTRSIVFRVISALIRVEAHSDISRPRANRSGRCENGLPVRVTD